MRIKFYVFNLFFFSSLSFGADWNCSGDDLLRNLQCSSSDGEIFEYKFSESANKEGEEGYIEDYEQVGFIDFLRQIPPGESIYASNSAGDILEGVSLGNGRFKGKAQYFYGHIYEGEKLGVFRHGKGKHTTPSNIYEGEFFEGRATGKGKNTSKIYDITQEGDFVDSVLNGQGTYTHEWVDEENENSKGRTVIKGQFKNGETHGYAKEITTLIIDSIGIGIYISEYKGDFFVREIIDGSPADRSTLKEKDQIISIKNRGEKKYLKNLTLDDVLNLISGRKGRKVTLEIKGDPNTYVSLIRDTIVHEVTTTYEGMYFENEKSGYGKEVSSEGRSYEGTFKNNKYHGFGKRTWGEGNTYYGSYKDGWCEGMGMQLNQNNDIIYYGEFHKCMAHGKGGSIFHSPDGQKLIKSGNFVEDDLEGYGEAFYENGDVYKGFWKKGKWYGHGEWYSSEAKEKIIITWKDDYVMENGFGTIITDEYKYSGEIKNFLKDGKGKYSLIQTDDEGNSFWGKEAFVIFENGVFKEYYDPEESKIENRIALVIGNGSAYTSSRLENSVSDSQGISETLEDKGFRVIHRTELTEKDFKQAIWDFADLVDSYDGAVTALFYYAGHAVQIDGNNYLIPVDSSMNKQQDIELEAINTQSVINALSKATNGLKILILDSCRTNPFKSYSRSIQGGLAEISAPLGTFIAYSTAPNQLALDGNSKGYGIYTGNLINALNVPGLGIEQVFKKTRRDVVNVTDSKQIPWESSSLIGDFYFSKEQ